MTSLLFCAAAILLFSGLYLILGRSGRRGVDPIGLNFAAFSAGALFSTAVALPVTAAQFPPRLVLVGAGIGLSAALGLVATTLAVRSGLGLGAISTTVSLSLSIPILLALAFYGESPAPHKWFALALAVASIVLIQGKGR